LKVLVTGFESREDKSNASDILVSSLTNDTSDAITALPCEVKFHILKDDTHTLKEEIYGLLDAYNPDFCLFTGQAPSRNNVTLECIATNYRYISSPPAIGEPAVGGKIEENGPDAYNSTLPDIPEIVKELKSNVIPAAPSRWGGNSLCNQVLYHGVHHSQVNATGTKCGFMHIPALPEQVISQWPDVPFMPLEMTRRAVEVVLTKLVNQ
jgi:pyroglutamyl-peptidase